jgi:hypothetical protein
VSNPGLIFYIGQAQRAHGLHYEIVELVGVGASADPCQAFASVYGAAQRVFFDEGVVARFLDPVADLVDCLGPGNVLPMIGAGPPHLRLEQPPRIQDVLLE